MTKNFSDSQSAQGHIAGSHLLKVFTDPQWDGGAPVSVSGNCPVTCLLQPISKPFFSYKLWNPVTERWHWQSCRSTRLGKNYKPGWHHKPLCDTLWKCHARLTSSTSFGKLLFCLFDYAWGGLRWAGTCRKNGYRGFCAWAFLWRQGQ